MTKEGVGLGIEQDKVAEAFEALQKALEEEQERLNDPTVTQLLRMLGNERLRLVEWMLGEVQKLATIWREGKAPVREINRGRDRLPRGESQPQSFYRIFILKALAEMDGRGRTKEVLERVFEMAKPYLSHSDFLKIGNVPRWHKNANWERYWMVREGLLRPDSPQGVWELTEAGWREAKKLMASETQEQ